MSDTESTQTPPKPRRRWRRILGYTMLVFLLASAAVFAAVRTPPKAWRAHQDYLADTTPEQREAVAQGVMDKLEALAQDAADETAGQPQPATDRAGLSFGELNAIDPEATYIDRVVELELTNAEMSSLIGVWFESWAEQRGFIVPDWLHRPVVGAFDGELSMAFSVSHEGWSQVFGGPLALAFHADGMAEGSVAKLTVGSLPVPLSQVGQALEEHDPDAPADAASEVGDWVAQLESFTFRPVLELQHRRRARVIAMDVGDETIALTLRLQDHQTYKQLNHGLAAGESNVFDTLTAIADVPTTSD